MARYNGPVCRLCRRDGLKLFLKGTRCDTPKCAIERRDSAPGMHQFRRGKQTDYGTHLREKQKVKHYYGVLERQLTGRDFISDDYSIADMACWPWVEQYHHRVGGLAEYPAIAAWRARIAARPAVQRALRLGLDWARPAGAVGK